VTVEERLARALHDEAERVDVDVARLHARTRDRLRPAPRDRGHLRVRPLVATAAAVALLLGGGVVVRSLDRPGPSGPAGQSTAGGVDTQFSCPAQVTADEAARVEDDALLVDLSGGPAAAAQLLGAPRYAYSEDGDRALLRLGNADGTLAATATFTRTGGGWRLDTTRRCVGARDGIAVPGTDELRLGRRDATPYPAARFALDPDGAVFVDDRTTYDQSGFARHRSVWAAPCDGRVCVAGGVPNSHSWGEIGRNRAPEDISGVLLDPDAMVGRKPSLVLWAVYDADGTVASVVARHRDGSTRPAEVVRGPGWTGRLLLLLDVPDRVARVTVRHTDGAVDDYTPEDIAD
jgi:hypothetical protein